ncbi:MAG: hypothetical protein HY654_00360, partial [Acidobacteria bacterium]|nr:hypothetical protein [Acidobacteriota bacterium]
MQRIKPYLALLTLLGFTILGARPASASVIVPATLEELAAEAVAILHGRV